jgi:hypothetical protein
MRPSFRPGVERLESLALLSGVAPIAATAAAVFGSPPLTLTLSTDSATYQAGQPVSMTLTEMNTSGHDITIGDGPSTDGFDVTKNGVRVWSSNAGPQPLFIRLITLHAGELFQLKSTWNDLPNTVFDPSAKPGASPVVGALVVHSQVHAYGVTANPVTIVVNAPTVPPPVTRPLVVRVTTDRASYGLKQSVTITLTETNTSGQPVPVLTGCQILSASAGGPLGPVWRYRDLRLCPTGQGMLAAGQSRQFTIVWNGLANLPGGRLVRGWYVIHAGADGVSGTAIVRIR